MSMWRAGIFALALAGMGSNALAYELQPETTTGAAPAAGADTTQDTVTVNGRRFREVVRSFVGELSAAPSGEDQLARWDRKVCPGVLGAHRDLSQALIDRIALRAYAVDLQVGEPGCKPNILIIVTDDSDRLAQSLVENERDLVAYHDGEEDGNTRGRSALMDFAETPRPVRWWHVTRTVSEDGYVLSGSRASSGMTDGFTGAQVLRVPSLGRLERTTRQDFDRVIIVLDTQRTAAVPFDALADYIAMAALAQLDPHADTTSLPSIMNLFSPPNEGQVTPAALTEWDMAYLQGLYGATRNAVDSRQQERAITRAMTSSDTATPAQ